MDDDKPAVGSAKPVAALDIACMCPATSEHEKLMTRSAMDSLTGNDIAWLSLSTGFGRLAIDLNSAGLLCGPSQQLGHTHEPLQPGDLVSREDSVSNNNVLDRFLPTIGQHQSPGEEANL